jgi:hypothetical protein
LDDVARAALPALTLLGAPGTDLDRPDVDVTLGAKCAGAMVVVAVGAAIVGLISSAEGACSELE